MASRNHRVPIRGVSTAGYSKTPLIKKLGIKPGHRICIKNAPDQYLAMLDPLPEQVQSLSRLSKCLDVIHVFVTTKADLTAFLPKAKSALRADGMIWVSWPKKIAKVSTDVTEDVIRAVALPLDFVDIKVCAIDEVWSGLKLVVRKEKRGTMPS